LSTVTCEHVVDGVMVGGGEVGGVGEKRDKAPGVRRAALRLCALGTKESSVPDWFFLTEAVAGLGMGVRPSWRGRSPTPSTTPAKSAASTSGNVAGVVSFKMTSTRMRYIGSCPQRDRFGVTPREAEVLHAATAMDDEAEIAWDVS
jgi:hypothetical protein